MPVHPNSLKNLENGKKFSKTYKPANTGRRKDYLKEFVDENRVSLNDLKIILESLILDHSAADIEKIFNSGKKTLPIGLAGFIKGLDIDLKKGRTDTLNSILDRVYGKATQSVNVSGIANTIPDDPAERRALADQLEKELKDLNEPTVQ